MGSPAHPVQQAISRRMALFTGLPEADVQPVVSDGCGAPTFALPLKAIATAFQRFGSPPDSFDAGIRAACSSILRAIIAHPFSLGGDARFDSAVVRVSGGRLVTKVGADGFEGCCCNPAVADVSGGDGGGTAAAAAAAESSAIPNNTNGSNI